MENQWQPVGIHATEPSQFSALSKVSLQNLAAGKSVERGRNKRSEREHYGIKLN